MKILTILLIALLVSCGNPPITSVPPPPSATPLQKAASILLTISQSVGSFQTSVINSNASGLLTDKTTASILAICTKINTFDSQAGAILKSANPNTVSILSLLNPIISAFEVDMQNGLVGIKDPTTKNTIQLSLLALQTLIITLQITLS